MKSLELLFVDAMPDENSTPIEHKQFQYLLTKTRDLVECIDIGATTYVRYRIKLDKAVAGFPNASHFPPSVYTYAAQMLASKFFEGRFHEECCVSYRITEDNGYVMNTTMKTGRQLYEQMEDLPDNVARKKLKGNFHLEILFVDVHRISDKELFKKYVQNINARLSDFSDTACLKDKANKAEKWLNMVKKKMAQQFNGKISKSDSIIGNKHNVIAEKWQVFLPEGIPSDERALSYSLLIWDIYKHHCGSKADNTTYSMFELLIPDSSYRLHQQIVIELRPHRENGLDVIAESLRKHDTSNYPPTILLMMYTVDIPAFASAKRAASRLNFVRKCLEICYAGLPEIMLEECDELFEKKCKCQKLHLSSYSSPKTLFNKQFKNAYMHSWEVTLSDLVISLSLEGTFSTADLYARIVSQICKSRFSGIFGVGTNILCELFTTGKDYISPLRHHSETLGESLKKGIFGQKDTKNIKLDQLFFVNVYVVDIMGFDTNVEAHQFLYTMRKDLHARAGFEIKCGLKIPVPKESIISNLQTLHKLEKETKPESVISNKTVSGISLNLVNEETTIHALNSSYFKNGSKLASKIASESVTLGDGYKILSSKTTKSTSKGRITIFLLELDFQFLSEVLDEFLFMAEILMEIVKNGAISLWSDRNTKVTLKWHGGYYSKYYILRDDDLENPKSLREELSRTKAAVYNQNQFHIEVQYRRL